MPKRLREPTLRVAEEIETISAVEVGAGVGVAEIARSEGLARDRANEDSVLDVSLAVG